MNEIYRVGKGTTIAAAISGLNLGRKPVAGRIGDRLVDLSVPLDADAEVALVFPGSPEALEILRHSAAHLLAQAVLELYPEAKTGVGPAVENGYYYDFLRETPFTPEDLEAIEKRMKEIVEADHARPPPRPGQGRGRPAVSRPGARSSRSSSSGRRATRR